MRNRITIVFVAAALALLALPAVAQAWCNGPSGADGFGTHDWILQEAERLAAGKGAGWVDLKVALPHTDDPDTVFHDFYYHVYDVWGSSHYGNAPKKVALYYAKALKARKAGNTAAASRYVGIMAHYFGDLGNPLHTDQCAAEDDIHSKYESDAQDSTDEVGENSAWVRFDGYTARTSVAGFTKRVAAASHKHYSTLVDDYAASGMTPAVLSITAKRLGAAANGLADLIIGIKRGVSGGTSASRRWRRRGRWRRVVHHRLHHEDRREVPPLRLPVPLGEQDRHLAGRRQGARLHALQRLRPSALTVPLWSGALVRVGDVDHLRARERVAAVAAGARRGHVVVVRVGHVVRLA